MYAFLMGRRGRELFAAYDPPADVDADGCAVVLCAPWGTEYFVSHRALRQLALKLSRSGCHVLRFDWYGTGDSEGGPFDGDLLGWVGDLSTAIDELEAISGVRRVWLVGLRLGAAIACKCAAIRSDIAGLVLWDPVFDGHPDVAEMQDKEGFPPGASLRVELEDIDLPGALVPDAGRLLVITSDERAVYSILCRRLVESGLNPTYEAIPGRKAWIRYEEYGTGALPVELLRRVVGFVSGGRRGVSDLATAGNPPRSSL